MAIDPPRSGELPFSVSKSPSAPPSERATRIAAAFRSLADAADALADAIAGPPPLVSIVEPPSSPPAPSSESYSTGRELCPDAIRKRGEAQKRAASIGYDHEHWSKAVRRFRQTEIRTSVVDFAAMLGVSAGCVHNWEAGTNFALRENLDALERLGRGYAWSREDWSGGPGGDRAA